MGSIAKTQQAIMLSRQPDHAAADISLGRLLLGRLDARILQPLARVLPLTFVVSSLREVIVNGLSLAEQIPTVLGLGVWLAIGLALAIRLFRWKEVAA